MKITETILPFIIGIASGVLAAFYGPYFSEAIKSSREKKSLRLAIYRELVYMYRLVSDLFESNDDLDIEKMNKKEKEEFLFRVSFFINYYKTFLYQHDLYQYIRNDFNQLKLFYQLEDSFVIEKTYMTCVQGKLLRDNL